MLLLLLFPLVGFVCVYFCFFWNDVKKIAIDCFNVSLYAVTLASGHRNDVRFIVWNFTVSDNFWTGFSIRLQTVARSSAWLVDYLRARERDRERKRKRLNKTTNRQNNIRMRLPWFFPIFSAIIAHGRFDFFFRYSLFNSLVMRHITLVNSSSLGDIMAAPQRNNVK